MYRVKNKKLLARVSELESDQYKLIMSQVNQVGARGGLRQYTTYSRIWEYPWLWLQLELLSDRDLRVLDIGSELSPFPWFLADQGFDLIISETIANYWRTWQNASRKLDVSLDKYILDAQNIDLPTASIDIYLSVSVIEHVPDKAKVISEAARVLRPGGLLIMTFDICEPDMGMTFPKWNGRALTMREFDDLFRENPWFESGLSDLVWNTESIDEYLSWNRTTAPHHNYITGGAVVRRNSRVWEEANWKNYLRSVRARGLLSFSLAFWYLNYSSRVVFRNALRLIQASRG